VTLSCEISRACALALATGLAIFAVPSEALAREVEYRAPAGCPDAGAVASRIETRAPRGGPARLSIQKTKNGFHGDLVVGNRETRVARSVDAQSCGAVVEALELVLALNSDSEEAPEAREAADERPPANDGAGRLQTVESGAVVPAIADQPANVDPLPRGRTFTLGSSVSYTSFSEGRVLFGGALFADVALPTRIGGVSFLQPSFRASLGGTLPNTRSGPVTFRPTDGPIHVCSGCGPVLTLAKSTFDVCPIGANLEGTVSVTACGRGELGVLIADVSGSNASAESHLWMAAGPFVRSRFMWQRDATWHPSFEVTAGLLAPLRRDRLHFDDHPTEVAPPWIWTVGMAAGVVFQ
jgi:hypothetical protein